MAVGSSWSSDLATRPYFAAVCLRSGIVGPELPHRIAQMLLAFERYGMLAGAVTIGAIRHGDRVAIRDERGDVTYRELDERTNALANAWRAHGLQPGDGVAILVRNHRGFLEAVFAAAKCGAKIILLNTSFAGPQIREVAEREGTDLLVYDDEYSLDPGGRGAAARPLARVGGRRGGASREGRRLAGVADRRRRHQPRRRKPGRAPKIVILTSGTTGTPKGAPRDEPRSLGLLGGLLSKVPFRARETTELAVPMFHALGFASMALGLALGSTLVVRRHFDPEATLDSLEDNRATALVVVPVMLQRMLELGEDAVAARDTSSLKVIFVSGSALSVDLVKRSLKAFGPVVYNMYGSTEVAYATIATPKDLAEEPGSVGKVVRGVVVKILDDDGEEVQAGATGRIFVGNAAQFEGYTGGETKEQIEGLMSSGDVGHFDREGRLFIDGRDDEMIVSGGENVFPAEVEELLAGHEAIEEAAVDRRRRREVRPAAEGLRGPARRRASSPRTTVKAYVKDNLARYKSPARRRVPGRAAAQPHRQGAQARARGRGDGATRGTATRGQAATPRTRPSHVPPTYGPPFASYQAEIFLRGLGGERARSIRSRLAELARVAQETADPQAFDYVVGGAGTEDTMRANEEAFRRWRIVPRMLRDVSVRDLSATVLGTPVPGPGGPGARGGPGDRASRRRAGIGARGGGGRPAHGGEHDVDARRWRTSPPQATRPKWFQLYWPADRELAASFLVAGRGRRLPGDHRHRSTPSSPAGSRGTSSAAGSHSSRASASPTTCPIRSSARGWPSLPRRILQAAVGEFVGVFTNPRLTWEDLEFLRSRTDAADRAQGHPPSRRRPRRPRARDGRRGRLQPRRPPGRRGDRLPGRTAGHRRRGRRRPGGAARQRHPLGRRHRQGARAGRRRGPAGPPLRLGAGRGRRGRGACAVLRAILAELDLTLGLSGHTAPGQLHPGVLVREGAG